MKSSNRILSSQRVQQTQTNQDDPLDKFIASSIKQLELKVSGDQDKKEIAKILTLLEYPSEDVALLHKLSNRLGSRDEIKEGVNIENKKNLMQNAVRCPCCGFIRQEQQLALCTKLEDIRNLGLPAYLYFQTIRKLIIILIETFFIYCLFAIGSNVTAAKNFGPCSTEEYEHFKCNPTQDFLVLSLGSKQENPTIENQNFYIAQAWLGLVMIIIWFVTLAILKYFQQIKEGDLDRQTRSPADFTIVIEGIPENFNQSQLQAEFKRYEDKIANNKSIQAGKKRSFIIKKFNKGKPFFTNEKEFQDEELQKLQKEQTQIKQKLAELILERQDEFNFKTNAQERQQLYKQYEQNLSTQGKKIKEIRKKMWEKVKSAETEHTTVAFVTMDSNLAKNLIVELNPRDYSSRIRNFITCKTADNNFSMEVGGKSLNIKVEEAPQPQDVIWENIGLTDSEKFKRKAITFTSTFLVLGVSLGIVFGLSFGQQNSKENRFLSMFISFIILGINFGIQKLIYRLSIYERDYTTIKFQISLAIKCIVAQLINSIMIPILANYFIKKNLYDKNGLADDVFIFSLTNSFLTPLLKIFDFSYIYKKLKAWYKGKPKKKLLLNQAELNQLHENNDFNIGEEYIYIVSQYLFVCFFISLHPIVCLFAICGYGLMHWTQKYALFNRMKRPIPGNNLVNTAMSHIIFLGPFIYSFGSLAWASFFPGGTPKTSVIPNMIALLFSLIMLVFPMGLVLECCLKPKPTPQTKYQDSRIYFSTQYDRRNPATQQNGEKDFEKYLQQQMKGKSKEEQQKITAIVTKNAANNAGYRPAQSFGYAPMMSYYAPQPYMMSPSYFPGMMQPSMMPYGSFNAYNPMIASGYQQNFIAPQVYQPQQSYSTIKTLNQSHINLKSKESLEEYTESPLKQMKNSAKMKVQSNESPERKQLRIEETNQSQIPIVSHQLQNTIGFSGAQMQPVGYQPSMMTMANQQPMMAMQQPMVQMQQPMVQMPMPTMYNQPQPYNYGSYFKQ